MHKLALSLTLAVTLAAGSPAAAQQDWRDMAAPYDLERLLGAGSQLIGAVDAARAAGSPEDIAALDGLLADAVPIDGEALLGDWRCRTVKLGGLGGLIVYGWFNCRISYGAEGLFFEKLSGSQRTTGYLVPDWPIDEGWGQSDTATDGEAGSLTSFVYLGAAHYGYEEPGQYNPTTELRNDTDNRNDPGFLEMMGPNHARIGFPAPIFESDYDFLELRR